MNKDLAKMRPNVFKENKVLNLTPESKIEKWIKIIQQKAISGYKVKLYSDIETTGFAFWSRGRSEYDEVIDKKDLLRDSAKFGVGIEALKNKDFLIDIKSPYCSMSFFDIKEPSSVALLVFGLNILSANGFSKESVLDLLSENNKIEDVNNFVDQLGKSLKNELSIEAKKEIKSMTQRAFRHLRDEAKELSGKVDRMIEYAFVACYENQDGEVFLLKDDDDDLIYFHEFVYPLTDNKIKEEQLVESMPMIPYLIHKTDFDFLKGEIEHPFLNIKLNSAAPDAGEIFKVLLKIFEYKGTEKEKELLSDNLLMFFHNGDGFDVPFIDEELNKFNEEKRLRDFIQTYDTLKIAKKMIPSDVQKFIAACQQNPNFGGNESIKANEEIAILQTSKSLDNIKRLAAYLIDFDPMKPKKIYEKAQSVFFEKFKNYFESMGIDWKKFENMTEYQNSKNPDINLTKSFPKANKNDVEYSDLSARYQKYLLGRKDYIQLLNKVKKHELIYKNLNNIKTNIENNDFLKDALYRLNNTDRSAHGARVDSQLFMDAFIVLENSLYLKPKMAKTSRHIDLKDLKLEEDTIKRLQELLEKGV